MNFDEYQVAAWRTAAYPDKGANLPYVGLEIAGEAGEVADKIKKLFRNRGVTRAADLTGDEKVALAKEAGDVLWGIAALATELGFNLDDIAADNIRKLK